MTTFRELEALVAVAEMGSFDKAAGKMHTSQAAVSRLIRELESAFPSPLFSREHRTARLTPEGLEVVQRAQLILRQRVRVMECVTGSRVRVENLRLGVTELVASTWLPRFLARVKELDPSTHIELVVGLSPNLQALLRSGRLDIAIVGNVIPASDDMLSIPVGSATFGWYCAAQHDLAEEPTRGAFEGETLLVLGASSGPGLKLADWFLGGALRPRHLMQCDNWVAMAGIAAAGLGVACLPLAAAQDPVRRGALRPVRPPVETPVLDFVALMRRNTTSSYHQDVVALARESCDFSVPFQAPLPPESPVRRG
jgi:DNA-binding transcriptional LysR family regulator